jgi:tetratricopeptide (TPR) repeat protein
MDREDENNELNDIKEYVKRYENMIRTGIKQWFDSDEYLDIADYYEETGQTKEATKVLKLAYKTFPNNDEVIIRMSQIYSPNMYHKAENLLKEHLKKDPNNNDICAALACLYIEHDDNEKGIKLLKEIINRIGKDNYEDNFVNYFFIGKAYTKEKKWISAEKYLQMALKANNDVDALGLYILCASDKRLKKRMTTFITSLIKEKPFNDDVWMTYGIIEYHFNNYQEAINAFDYAIAIDKKEHYRHLYKGLSLKELDKKQEAIIELLLANKYNKIDTTSLFEVANLYIEQEEYKNAINIYKDLLENEEYREECYFHISFCYFALGNKKLGEKYEKLAVEECYDYYLMIDFAKDLYVNDLKNESEVLFEDLLLNEDDDIVVESTITLAYLYKDDNKILQAIQILKDSIHNITSSNIALYYCLLDIASYDKKFNDFASKLILDVLANFSISAKTIIKRCPNLSKNKILINYIKEITNGNK